MYGKAEDILTSDVPLSLTKSKLSRDIGFYLNFATYWIQHELRDLKPISVNLYVVGMANKSDFCPNMCH